MKREFQHPFHSVLPISAQRELMAAAETPITPEDPLARRKAVDRAMERVKQKYPEYFRGYHSNRRKSS
jgi:hypothetical protein